MVNLSPTVSSAFLSGREICSESQVRVQPEWVMWTHVSQLIETDSRPLSDNETAAAVFQLIIVYILQSIFQITDDFFRGSLERLMYFPTDILLQQGNPSQ